jgi:homoserine/homoserine lactone efflux protein
MISTAVLAAFVAASILLALTPGPNMSLTIANTLSGGLRGGLTTLAGTGTALAILAATAALGMTTVMALMAEWFDVVRWVGAVYLIFLGGVQLRAFWRRRTDATFTPPVVSASGSYLQGLAVGLSNPKVLLFLGAFFPQFVSADSAPGPQLALLAALFVVTLVIVDIGYTFAVARARQALDARRLAVLDGLAGGLLVAGGVVLATMRRPG